MELLFSTARLMAYKLGPELKGPYKDYIIKNREHLKPFEPKRAESYFQDEAIQKRLEEVEQAHAVSANVKLTH